MLVGIVVASRLGVQATVFYLAVYLPMNMAAFAVIVARERETGLGDSIRRWPGWARAPAARVADDDLDAGARGHPVDRRLLRQVLPDRRVRIGRLHMARRGDRGRLDDLARVLPAGDRRHVDARSAGRPGGRRQAPTGPLPALAGGSPELDGEALAPRPQARLAAAPQPEAAFIALLAGAATIFLFIAPQPLFNLRRRRLRAPWARPRRPCARSLTQAPPPRGCSRPSRRPAARRARTPRWRR